MLKKTEKLHPKYKIKDVTFFGRSLYTVSYRESRILAAAFILWFQGRVLPPLLGVSALRKLKELIKASRVSVHGKISVKFLILICVTVSDEAYRTDGQLIHLSIPLVTPDSIKQDLFSTSLET